MLIIDRYMAKEFTGPFFAAAAGFTIMLLSGLLFELTDLIVDKKMAIDVVMKLLVYKIPSIVVISLPIAALFGTILALGRLAKDSEIVVLLGTGTPFRRLSLSLLIFAIVISGFNFILNEWIVPESNHKAETLYREALFRDPLPSIEEGIFFKGAEQRYFYVGRVNRRHKTMSDIMIYQLGTGKYPEMITAARGEYSDHAWILEDGIRKRLDDQGFTVEDSGFEHMVYPMAEGPEVYLGKQKTTDEMTRKELGEHIRLFKKSGMDVKRFEVDYHMKVTLPLAGLVWVLVGAPLSLRSARSGRFFGIVACILLAFLYFVFASLFRSLGGHGIVDPLVAAWATNAIYFLAGLILLIRADRV